MFATGGSSAGVANHAPAADEAAGPRARNPASRQAGPPRGHGAIPTRGAGQEHPGDGRPRRSGRLAPWNSTKSRIVPLDPVRLRSVLSPDALAAFEHTLTHGRELLNSRTFWNVNSTAYGGGVAEMLRSLIGYARGHGLDVRWAVIEGTPNSSPPRSACTTDCTDTAVTEDRWARPTAPAMSAAATRTPS